MIHIVSALHSLWFSIWLLLQILGGCGMRAKSVRETARLDRSINSLLLSFKMVIKIYIYLPSIGEKVSRWVRDTVGSGIGQGDWPGCHYTVTMGQAQQSWEEEGHRNWGEWGQGMCGPAWSRQGGGLHPRWRARCRVKESEHRKQIGLTVMLGKWAGGGHGKNRCTPGSRCTGAKITNPNAF